MAETTLILQPDKEPGYAQDPCSRSDMDQRTMISAWYEHRIPRFIDTIIDAHSVDNVPWLLSAPFVKKGEMKLDGALSIVQLNAYFTPSGKMVNKAQTTLIHPE